MIFAFPVRFSLYFLLSYCKKLREMPLYFIALIPDPGLREKIRLIKEEIKEKYNSRHALKLPAHITLQIPFKMNLDRETELIDILEDLAEKEDSFKVDLSGYGAFAPRVLFIKIRDHRPVKLLHQKIQKLLEDRFHFQEKEKTKEIHPHITLATRDLTRENFFIAWKDLKEKDLEAWFFVKSFFLLKYNGKSWDILREIRLKN